MRPLSRASREQRGELGLSVDIGCRQDEAHDRADLAGERGLATFGRGPGERIEDRLDGAAQLSAEL